ncbi:MAG: ATP-binding protein [Bryobacterales bacterium]|nr:ATP-binding protein [Bryobacterales bacterium]
MTVIARKYNPGFLTDDELVASFCVRTEEFESMVETLRECTGNSNTHQIVIGPRGSGKTSLLLRVAAEIRRDADLSSRFFPIVFAEESYEVSTAGEFWLECLSRLSDQAPSEEGSPDLRRTFEELRQIRDDRTLADRCLGALQDFADRECRRLVLIVENLNMLLGDIGDEDAGWQLRHTLQTEPRVLLLASATSRFQEIDDPKRAFYDLFRLLPLRSLDRDDCATLWQTVSGQSHAPETIQPLRILTGGSPRLLTIVARFGANLSFRELMADLLDLVDDHTEYFKSHLDALPHQERKVYLAVADLWKPASAREIADRARLNVNQCSAQLKRLTSRGAIMETGGTPRRKLYYVSERLYNIYYLMRRARGPAPLVQALIHFMEAFYSPTELKNFVGRIMKDMSDSDSKTLSLHEEMYEQFIQMLSRRTNCGELRPFALEVEFDRACTLEAPEALTAWESFICRFSESTATEDQHFIAAALVGKGMALASMDRLDEAIAAWNVMVQRFRISDTPEVLQAVALARFLIGGVLASSDRPREALAAWRGLLQEFGDSNTKEISWIATRTFARMGDVLLHLDSPDLALSSLDLAIRRFESEEPPEDWKILPTCEILANSLASKGTALLRLDQPEEALDTWQEVVRRFGLRHEPQLRQAVSQSLFGQGKALTRLDRSEQAMTIWDDVVRRNNSNATAESAKMVASALVEKGALLIRSKKRDEALAVWEEILERFAQDDDPALRDKTEFALLMKAAFEMTNGQSGTAIDLISPVLERQGGGLDNKYLGYRLRARAFLAEGMPEACERDVALILAIMPNLDLSDGEAINDLIDMASDLNMKRMRDMIKESPACELLLPLTTALEMELGLQPRVAKEVEEVAEDIREQFRLHRQQRFATEKG